MIRKCMLALGVVLLASGCGSSSGPEQTTVADSPPAASSSGPAPDTGTPTPETSESSPAADPTVQEPVEETPTIADSPSPDEESTADDGSSSGDDVEQKTGPRSLNCSAVPGSGTFTDPLQLGVVDGPVIARGCATLTAGSPFNARYFSFTLSIAPGAQAHAGAAFTITPDALGPVYPAIVLPNGWVLKNSLGAGYWTGTEPYFTGRYQQMPDLAPGPYILRTEKLDSPLHSFSTPSFDVVVDPDSTTS
ncbi:hypothetical protein [Streptomyces sp. NBC_00316]|uniref:hypothetical protein n=1 Tax=Streptomyces sp. NBC_00316 TaxID=2975710 RepID=UPI002E2A0EBF|nr:hypothetical protein [Streptomyces sp. NBC_00316]